MSTDALSQSLRRWKEDSAPDELKRYARREWGAETGFFYLHSGPKRQSSVRSSTAALFRMIQSLLSIARNKSVNKSKPPAGKASTNRSVRSPEIRGLGNPNEDVGTELADSLIRGLGQKNHRTGAEIASALISGGSEDDEHH